jgi:hypothetical protein
MRTFCVITIGATLIAVGNIKAQTNFQAFSLFDTPPITGTADSLTGGLEIGEINTVGFPLAGLARAELITQLPQMPASSSVASATLSLYLDYNTGATGNSTFGALSIYHDVQHDSFTFNTTDYSDPDYALVTSSFVTPASPAGQYYSIDVTDQISQDYAHDGPNAIAAFRFQVDGIQYQGGLHEYEFYFASSPFAASPAQLNVQFTTIPEPGVDSLGLAAVVIIFLGIWSPAQPRSRSVFGRKIR